MDMEETARNHGVELTPPEVMAGEMVGGVGSQKPPEKTSDNDTYATAYYDREGVRLNGRDTYLLRIEGDNLPPVTSF